MMLVYESLEYTNSLGITMRIPEIVRLEGLGDLDADIQDASSPYQDGTNFIDLILKPRIISVEFILKADDYSQIQLLRSQLVKSINPKLGLGILRYKSNFREFQIRAIADGVPYFPDGQDRGEKWQRATIDFYCPNPYWQSLTITEEPTFEALFEFPFEGEVEMGMQLDQRVIVNDGDVAASLLIEFNGPAVNPKIINQTTGEFIRVRQELFEGEKMIVNTADDETGGVHFVGADGQSRNVFNWIDLDSTFFKLVVGENIIEYTADSDIQGAVVNISYQKLYQAI